jgi:hypothetical protein
MLPYLQEVVTCPQLPASVSPKTVSSADVRREGKESL